MSRREPGFIFLWRQLLTSPMVRELGPEQAWVWVVMLLEAGWRAQRVQLRDGPVWIARGEFITSQVALAVKAGVGRQVVRTVYAKALDHQAIRVRDLGPSANHRGNHRIICTTIVNYERFQEVPRGANHRSNPILRIGEEVRSDRPDLSSVLPSVDREVEEPIFNMDEWRRRRDARLSALHGHHGS